jgi:hypothetical protein
MMIKDQCNNMHNCFSLEFIRRFLVVLQPTPTLLRFLDHKQWDTQQVGLIWASDRLVAEATTYRTQTNSKRRISMPSAGFLLFCCTLYFIRTCTTCTFVLNILHFAFPSALTTCKTNIHTPAGVSFVFSCILFVLHASWFICSLFSCVLPLLTTHNINIHDSDAVFCSLHFNFVLIVLALPFCPYCTTQISTPPAGFEPATPASDRP